MDTRWVDVLHFMSVTFEEPAKTACHVPIWGQVFRIRVASYLHPMNYPAAT